MAMAVNDPRRARNVMRAVDELRELIVSGELLPGQQIRQEAIAERLGVSRLPVREALRQLTADGLVRHTPNVGFNVTRLSRPEFDEIYLMRRALETELLRSLSPVTESQLAGIVALNDAVASAAESADPVAMQRQNHAFHFAIFGLSPYRLVLAEIERLWTWAAPYHAVYLLSPESRARVVDEHHRIIDALRLGDNEMLARAMDEHRHGAEKQVADVFLNA